MARGLRLGYVEMARAVMGSPYAGAWRRRGVGSDFLDAANHWAVELRPHLEDRPVVTGTEVMDIMGVPEWERTRDKQMVAAAALNLCGFTRHVRLTGKKGRPWAWARQREPA